METVIDRSGMQKGVTTLENSLAFSYKVKHLFTIRSKYLTLRYLLHRKLFLIFTGI